MSHVAGILDPSNQHSGVSASLVDPLFTCTFPQLLSSSTPLPVQAVQGVHGARTRFPTPDRTRAWSGIMSGTGGEGSGTEGVGSRTGGVGSRTTGVGCGTGGVGSGTGGVGSGTRRVRSGTRRVGS